MTEASSPPHISNNKNTAGITLQDHHGQYFTPFSIFVGFECVYSLLWVSILLSVEPEIWNLTTWQEFGMAVWSSSFVVFYLSFLNKEQIIIYTLL